MAPHRHGFGLRRALAHRAARTLLLGLALALLAPAPLAFAQYLSEAESEAWAERLAEAAQEIEEARGRVAELEAAWSRARHDDYPRGEAREELLARLERARAELREAEARLPELVEEARRAGALPEVLRPYR